MNTKVLENLRKVEIFGGLDDNDLTEVAAICQGKRFPEEHVIFREGAEGDELYIIHDGSVRVMINTRTSEGVVTTSTINMLYGGQCFGELVLLGGIARSATITTAEATTFIVIRESDFRALCDTNPRIGYIVMRNLAQDLAYKLRSSNLLLRGDIRWQGGELGKTQT